MHKKQQTGQLIPTQHGGESEIRHSSANQINEHETGGTESNKATESKQ